MLAAKVDVLFNKFMTSEVQPTRTVKGRYEACKGSECPRLLELMKEREDGTRYFVEGDLAYQAMVLCNNWTIGLSDGDCPVKPTDVETRP